MKQKNAVTSAEPVMIPPHETPCCRLAERSAEYLSDTELLSLVLKGTMGTSRSLDTARRLLSVAGSIRDLAGLSLAELQRFPGIGLNLACRIQSALALARRLDGPAGAQGRSRTGPATVAELLEDGLPALVRELAIPLFLAGESGEGLDARLTEAGVAPLSMDTAEGLAPLDERLKADP